MSKDVFKEMVPGSNYQVTKEEFLKMASLRAGSEEIAAAAFEAMDTSKKGVVSLWYTEDVVTIVTGVCQCLTSRPNACCLVLSSMQISR